MARADYTFITARIKAREKYILNKTDIERMISSKNTIEAFKVFHSTDYADNLFDAEAADYYRVLMNDFEQVKFFCRQNVPDEELNRLLFAFDDFLNLKILFKSKYSLSPVNGDDFSRGGFYDAALFQRAVMEDGDKDTGLPDFYHEIASVMHEDLSPRQIDAIIDRIYFQYKQRLADWLGYEFIQRYVSREIDLANAKICLRYWIGEHEDEVSGHFIVGGGQDVETWTRWCEDGAAASLKKAADLFGTDLWETSEKFFQKKAWAELEEGFLSAKNRIFDTVRYVSYGPEVVVEYIEKKRTAMINVRKIMIGLKSGFSHIQLRDRVRTP